ncbi:hypothetical protein [Halorussus halobius]|uniref:hypothetical protein n=1 Tax=Halorussus halobius TaxID=1710537 RepID=UPI0010922149|nr:hypothetical protein [Halorussus halobius]
MIHWQTAKRWTYRGRSCEIQRASVAGECAYRGLVAVDAGLADPALDDAPVAGARRKRRRERHDPGSYREWVCFQSSDESVSTLRERVNDLARHVADAEC